MKKIKYLGFILIAFILLTTGCLKRDNLEGIEIVTTIYPLEFATNYLYGEHSIVNSIYPDGVDTSSYKLSQKQIKDYSRWGKRMYRYFNEILSQLITYEINIFYLPKEGVLYLIT